MAKVVVQASMSLDGFIVDTNDQVGPLIDWYSNGDVEFMIMYVRGHCPRVPPPATPTPETFGQPAGWAS